jgi:hypothetical protein
MAAVAARQPRVGARGELAWCRGGREERSRRASTRPRAAPGDSRPVIASLPESCLGREHGKKRRTNGPARRRALRAAAAGRVPGLVAGQPGQRHGHHGARRGCRLADDHARRHPRPGGAGADRDAGADPAPGAAGRDPGRSLGPAPGSAPGPALDRPGGGRAGRARQPRPGHARGAPALHLRHRRRRGADRPRLAGERARDRAAGGPGRRGHAQRRRHEHRPRRRAGDRRPRGRRRGRGGRVLPERRDHAGPRDGAPVVAAPGAGRRPAARAPRRRDPGQTHEISRRSRRP